VSNLPIRNYVTLCTYWDVEFNDAHGQGHVFHFRDKELAEKHTTENRGTMIQRLGFVLMVANDHGYKSDGKIWKKTDGPLIMQEDE
jgi:hypothetical protein